MRTDDRPRDPGNGSSCSRRAALRRGAVVVSGVCGLGALGATGRRARADTARSGAKITRLTGLRVESERWKTVGKNSHLGVHGKVARDRVLVIETDAGLTGSGSCSSPRKDAARLLGTDPLSYYSPGAGVTSPLGHGDAPLWDLVGKIYREPVWKLLGGYGPETVAAYDGSIYFSDLEPGHAGRGVARILEEVEHGLEKGHRAFKIKVGRGFKWMEREEGLKRDIAVVRAIRREVGPEIRLMTDSNNGYDLATTKRFLDEVDDDLFFVEEMFPESVKEDLELKRWLRGRGWSTLVADGESAREVEHFEPYIAARALDVLQGDIRAFGFTRLLGLARRTATTGIRLAPHNWGSYLGFYMQAVVGRGIPNFLTAEQDPAASDLFAGSGDFVLADGRVRVPDTPGLGIDLRLGAALRARKPDWVIQ